MKNTDMRKGEIYKSKLNQTIQPRRIISVGEIVRYYDFKEKTCTKAEFQQWIKQVDAEVKVCNKFGCTEWNAENFDKDPNKKDWHHTYCRSCRQIDHRRKRLGQKPAKCKQSPEAKLQALARKLM